MVCIRRLGDDRDCSAAIPFQYEKDCERSSLPQSASYLIRVNLNFQRSQKSRSRYKFPRHTVKNSQSSPQITLKKAESPAQIPRRICEDLQIWGLIEFIRVYRKSDE
uniref:Uncharacterized protein n=1 Tax=Opuntia streptacantha TaxID=393608 RepID=A0A7C8ZFY9_OPUST